VNRTEKKAVVEEMAGLFRQSPHVFLTDYRGLTAHQSTELRRRIRAAGGGFRVVKNRLARRAGAGTAAEGISERFKGPCGLATHRSDPIALAKVLSEFCKDNPQLRLVAAVVDGREVVDAEGVKFLAMLPGLPETRARLLALVQTPATMLVRLLQTPGSQIARALDARREKEEADAKAS
jgi:large subunit ribosomal protein L10